MSAEQHPSLEVTVDFTLKVGAGQLQASLQVPAGKVTLTQLLPVLQTLTSSIVNSTVGIINTEGYQVSCRAGCGACCRQLVPLSLFEAEALAAWIRTLPPERQAGLEQRFHVALLAFRDSGMLARLDPATWVEGSLESKSIAMDYLALKIPCPFLVDESCSIHPIRPLVCREYLVTSPAAFCSAPTQQTVVTVPLPIKPSLLLYQLGAQLEPGTHGWIPLIFLFAWMQSDSHPGDAVSAPGPELLYEFVKRLS
jgi:Fe-S-cluster containining protein